MTKWICPGCGLVLKDPVMPVRCSCGYQTDQANKRSHTNVRKIDLSDCIYKGPITHESISCSCPSSGREMLWWCNLHQCLCTRSPTTKRVSPDQRSCAQCYGLDEGYTKKDPQLVSEQLRVRTTRSNDR